MASDAIEKNTLVSKKITGYKKNIQKNRYYFFKDSVEFYLTQRQMEICNLLIKGLTYKKIGSDLGIGARTVECHINMLRTKLRVKNKKALIRLLGQLPPFRCLPRE